MVPFRVISFCGGPVVRAGIVIQSCLALLLWGRWRPAIFLVSTVGGAGVANAAVKRIVDRRRPRSLLRPLPDQHSFPSGHSSGMAALAGSLAYVVWLLTGRAVAAGAALLAGGAMAGAVGYARVVLDRHHTGDVLAGYVLGLGAVAAGVTVERRTAPREEEV